MKILYIAFECNPYRGSEAYCGWSWVRTMMEKHEVHVITRPENQKGIESYIEKNPDSKLWVNYCSVPVSKYLKISKGYQFMLYFNLWTNRVYKVAKELHEKEHYDYIHQVTLGDFRFTGQCWKLNAKFVFGPVGGGQITPSVFSEYTKMHWKEERLREFINISTTWKLSYKKAINKASLIYSANEETKQRIDKRLKDKTKSLLLTENGINQELIDIQKNKTLKEKEKVVILWSGRMIYRKGLMFLLEVISTINSKTPFEVWLFGNGPESSALKKYVAEKHLESIVYFKGAVSYEEMQKSYENADIFAFPSLRETTGTVLFEAMVNKLAIITFNQNGGKLLLQNGCGVLVDVYDELEKVKECFAEELTKLIENYAYRKKIAESAFEKLEANYTWEQKRIILENDLKTITNKFEGE